MLTRDGKLTEAPKRVANFCFCADVEIFTTVYDPLFHQTLVAHDNSNKNNNKDLN